ncbi:hypothetical protein BC835DRAFT_1275429 [Cytidiella melzeri]|nr:hypothetical protein BC835DRAFT_1275429 [Cytidiella melzeri]
MAVTTSFNEAWIAYSEVASLIPAGTSIFIPWQYLHRLVRLVVGARPRIRAHFECLLEILARIHETGGTVESWEWNVLLDAAGKGLRKTTVSQFKDVLLVYDDLLCRRPPGASLRATIRPPSSETTETVDGRPKPKPDQVTMATLLHLASRTRDNRVFGHAISMLHASGIRPNRDIYLTLMERHSSLGNLQALRAVIIEMKRRNIELGLEGLTLYMWALARLENLDLAQKIYTALRGNTMSRWTEEVKKSRKYLASINLDVPTNLLPDEVTYTAMIQAYAYHGDFHKCVRTFVEMVKALTPPSNGETPTTIAVEVVLPAYRAMFLGFYHHSQTDLPTNSPLVRYSQSMVRSSQGWTLSACQTVFDDWLRLPHKTKPNLNTLYWILKSFDTLTGGDSEYLRGVVERLETRFDAEWGGRLAGWINQKVDDEPPRP